MRNIKMTIEYDGTRYRGWQRLSDSENTIQGKVENVLSIMCGENIEIIGSGRTDAGVHAYNQVANFRTNTELSTDEIMDYCYKYLPEDIVIKRVEDVHDMFHSRYNAKVKKYLYKICNKKYHDVFNRKYCVHVDKILNIEAMVTASGSFIGQHDFRSFTALKAKKKSTVREIYSIDISCRDGYIDMIFEGNGFLQGMVRILAGTLIEVGLGNIAPDEVINILEGRDRSLAGPTAPPEGLFLMDVVY